jgi:hypothetical protein
MRTLRRVAVLSVLSTMYLLGCCSSEPAAPANEFLGIMHEADVVLQGRRFKIAVLDVPRLDAAPAPSARVMTVAGDGREISFHVSNAPTAPTIVGATLQFGSHAFTVTAVPGEYEVDGRPERLAAVPRAVHVFSDGRYHGVQER